LARIAFFISSVICSFKLIFTPQMKKPTAG
jgi:hypothetical protein